MKTLLPCIYLFASVAPAFGDDLGLPENDPLIQGSLNTPPVPAPTEEELAAAPQGEIRKLHLREVNRLRAAMADNLAAASPAQDGQQSPWFSKFQAWKSSMDKLATSRLQRDALDMLPLMQELSDARGTSTFPEFFYRPTEIMREFGYTMIHIIAEHVTEQNANVAAADLANFIKIFGNRAFISPTAWEDEIMPMDSAGIMILDATEVVTQLKAQPWAQAEKFLRSNSAADAFKDYEPSGIGLAALKTKFAANKATIIAKWNELAAWVAEQRTANS